MIRNLNKKGDGERTVTIFVGAPGSGNSAVSDDKTSTGKIDWTNATNGKGANATIKFDPASNPSILTKDAKTGIVSGANRPKEIGIAHEMIHGQHINKGTVDMSSGTTNYKTASGTQTQTIKKEEINTIGLSGSSSNGATENKIRKEQGLDARGGY